MAGKPSYKELEEKIRLLEKESHSQKRYAKVNSTLFEISRTFSKTFNLDELFEIVHRSLRPAIDTTNFYIALYDEARDSLEFPYIVDSVDVSYPPVTAFSKTVSITAEVIRKKKPLLLNKTEIEDKRAKSNLNVPACTTPEIWLGVPLINRDNVIGVMAVQSYTDPYLYDQKDLRLMASAANLVAISIEHKLADSARQESEGRFNSLVDLAVSGILLGSVDGTIIAANAFISELTGTPREKLIGRHVSQLPFTKESIEKAPLRFDLVRQGQSVSSERVLVRPDGSEVFVEMRTKMMPDRTYQSIFSDITVRKEIEKDLRESEERFRTLHNASFGGIVIHDQGIILDCNQGLSTLTGYTVEELIGMDGLGLIAPDWLEVVVGKIKSGFEQEYEVEGLRKDGSRYPISIRGSMIPYKGRTVRVTEFRDITERKKADDEKLKLKAQLYQAQKMESVGQLAGGVAHDFNNMLGVIIGHAEIAIHKTDPTAPIFNDLIQISKAGKRSADMTRQLLAFARKQTVWPQVIELNEALDGMYTMLRPLIRENIDFTCLPEGDLWAIKMDPSQFEQILVNLCLNAEDAINGIGTITITIENRTLKNEYCSGHIDLITGEYIRITVKDSGCGIHSEMLGHVFEPFFTTKGVGEGTGLGLATVYGTIKQNNGFIGVDSELGQGATFTIHLPRYIGDVKKILQSEASGLVKGGNETILLVEDEPAILEMTQTILQNLGYFVLAAGAPSDAFELAEKYDKEIDLLLTDVVMPEMNGSDLAKRLKISRPSILCLFMSGYSADIISSQGALEEGVYCLQKPFSQEKLSRKIRETLDG